MLTTKLPGIDKEEHVSELPSSIVGGFSEHRTAAQVLGMHKRKDKYVSPAPRARAN